MGNQKERKQIMRWYCEYCEEYFEETDHRLVDYTKDRRPICLNEGCGRTLDPAEDDAED